MKTQFLLATGLCAAVLAGCSVDPQRAAEFRAAMNAKVFPNPADRQGIEMTFPLESAGIFPTLEVVWRPNAVSQAEVTRRVRGFCGSQGSRLSGEVALKTAVKDNTWKLPSGQVVPVKSAFFRCLSS